MRRSPSLPPVARIRPHQSLRLVYRELLILLLCLIVLFPGIAQARLIPDPPALNATSWLLMDARTGHIITENNIDQRVPPASLSKMMTSYIASQQISLGNITLQDQVLVSENAWRKGGSKTYIEVGQRVSVEDLLRGVIIQSGNDASIALAEHIAGSEDAFASLMNQQAERLGMRETHYDNATGWPSPGQYTTARDLAKLARALIYDYPEHYRKYSDKEFVYNGIRQSNRNRLLWLDSSVDGIKTGHTEEAGYCLVSSAMRDDTRLVAVVMGTPSDKVRSAESLKLLTYGFRFFETVRTHTQGQELSQTKLWYGEADQLRLGTAQEIWLTVPKGATADIQMKLSFPERLTAPFKAGETLGKLQLSLDGEIIHEAPLVSLDNAPEGSIFRRLWHFVLLFFMDLIA
jgi:D-alanyl-D-alanine carboxypeptidase (penicillin-binding protein 5/6)